MNNIIQRNKTTHQKAGQAYKRTAIATLIAGLLFVLIGVLPVIVSGNYDIVFISVMGLVFLLWSYFSYKSGTQIAATQSKASAK